MPASNPPLQRVAEFLRTESAGGVVLIAATVVALVWANVAPASYHDLWSTTLSLPGPEHALSLEAWVNEGLMTIFFFVVGLEVKREIVEGELREPRAAMVPIAAALGGMVVPAALFALVTLGSGLGHGWGIPMATDIAFAVGILRLVAPRAPRSVGLTLLTLAIVDDIGAILVIAVFYSTGISFAWLLGALGLLVIIRLAGRVVAHPLWFVVPAVVLWVEMLRSGVHATLAGVLLGLATPVVARNGRPVLDRLEHGLHPWSSFLVLPLFALANAGIPISTAALRTAATNPAAIGILVGLVVGKVAGINLGIAVAARAGGRVPEDLTGRARLALGLLGGIGLTVSLFIAGLSYVGTDLSAAKLAILVASTAAAVLAAGVLRTIRPVPDAAA
jgi:NhaA family Na+:H+ antiporter